MITAGQAGQGISVYGYWTRWARDICVWLLDKLGKGYLCMVTGQLMCMYDYCWTSWARDICVWLLDKGCVCMITGQNGQGISVYGYWTRDVYV